LATAQAVALQVGLVTEDDLKGSGNVVMDAQAFDEATRDGKDADAVQTILSELRVLAKCTPKHRV
jgi:magnesium-transporting ATPase (P-type)